MPSVAFTATLYEARAHLLSGLTWRLAPLCCMLMCGPAVAPQAKLGAMLLEGSSSRSVDVRFLSHRHGQFDDNA